VVTVERGAANHDIRQRIRRVLAARLEIHRTRAVVDVDETVARAKVHVGDVPRVVRRVDARESRTVRRAETNLIRRAHLRRPKTIAPGRACRVGEDHT